MPVDATLSAYNPADHIPPPHALFPSLKLVHTKHPGTYRAYLSAELTDKLGLRRNQPIDLRPNTADPRYWYLDLRPTAPNRVNWYEDTRPRIQRLLLPATALGGEQSLRLCLVPGEPPHPGYYLMMPDAFFAAK